MYRKFLDLISNCKTYITTEAMISDFSTPTIVICKQAN